MNRRKFLVAGGAVAGALAMKQSARAMEGGGFSRAIADAASGAGPNLGPNLDLARHRFGVNYTPSRNWWFCWNDWDPDPIRRDLDAIAALGADHLRLMLIWPSFNRLSNEFYTDATMRSAQQLLVRELARVMKPHGNIIGFDFGNELNTCWKAPLPEGDQWMANMFDLMNHELPNGLHVNGVDHHPWFESDTFSPQALAAARFPVMHCYPFWTGATKYGGAMDPPSVKLLAGMAALIRSYAESNEKPVFA